MKSPWWFLLAALLVLTVYSPILYYYYEVEEENSNNDFFFGVTFGGNTTDEAKLLVDKVKGCTNLFVVNNWDITTNETALNEICDYAVTANLNVLVYFNFILVNYTRYSDLFTDFGLVPFHMTWLSTARERWGNKFLGIYLYDEPGGKQIDAGYYTGNTTTRTGGTVRTFRNVANYSDAAEVYVRSVGNSGSMQRLVNSNYTDSIANSTYGKMPVFTADNALYWFDYLSGYDAVFAELGWNHNEAQHIALCRGAANVQDKQWGAIITWTYNDPPYLASGPKIFQEMLTAYWAGAKYVIVFNYPKYPETNPYGILTEEHFTAIKRFYAYVRAYPRGMFGKVEGQVVFVLPKDYGWGMRQPNDKIWGLWEADELSPLIGTSISKLIKQYGLELDIIYDDPRFNYTENYSKIYSWNGTTYLSPSSVFNVPPPYELYASLVVVTIVMTCVPSYLIMRNKKRRKPEATIAGSASKANLTNLGRGKLELVCNKIRFYTEKGYFRKRKEIVREISVTDIESIKRIGSEFSVTWKGVTDVFVIEETDLVGIISKRITENQEEQRRILQDKKAAKQERNELAKILSVALEIVDSLFDILRSLHGQVDWNRVESYLKRSEENGRNFINQKIGAIDLDFTKLLLAVNAHHPKITSKETYRLLRTLYEYFRGLTSKNEFLDEIHPNCHDAKTTILAYYTLNDVILGTIVGDEETARRESNELVTMLDNLSKGTDLKINVDALKGVISKLGIEKGKESAVEEIRMVFRQQLKAIITDLGKA